MLATFGIGGRTDCWYSSPIENILVGFVLAAVLGVVIGLIWAAAKRRKRN